MIYQWITGNGLIGDVMHVVTQSSRRRAVVAASKPGMVMVMYQE